jgi:4-amino-4-deoxy-L-arabinose transferase-like glycosyltransferase
MALKNKKYIFLLIIAIAIFFRFFQLSSIPPGLYHDEAINANEAFFSLENANYRIFYPENNGREGLFIWLISLSFSVFGVSILAFKFIPAIIGTLTVIGLYLLTKELFSLSANHKPKAVNIALLSSFFLAISFWHVNFSRIGFRAILVPFLLVFSFYFLIKGFRKQSKNSLILSGFIFGLGLYTYTVFRLAALLLGTILLLFYVLYKKENLRKNFLKDASYILLAILIITIPIGIYYLNNPENFLGRTGQVSVFAQENPIKAFIQSMLVHLASFNFYGDANWRHNFSGNPQLSLLVGILFLIGIFLSFRELISSLKQKSYSLSIIHLILISWLLIMTIPAALTYEGIPHALRTIGTIPVIYIFAALGACQTYNWLKSKISDKKLLTVVCLLFLSFLISSQLQKYFITWANHPETKNAFSYDYLKIGNYLNSLPEQTQKIVVVNASGVSVPYPDGLPMPAQSIIFIENAEYGKTRSFYILEKDLNNIIIKEPAVIIPMQYNEELFQTMITLFPQGTIINENGVITYAIQ